MDEIEDKAREMVKDSATMEEVIRALEIDILDWYGMKDTASTGAYARRRAHVCYIQAVEWII